MAGARFEVRMAWVPAPEAAARGSRGGARGPGGGSELDGARLEVGAEEAAGCWEEGGAYRLRPAGLDAADFLFAAGPEEPLRPLGAVASGGESARVMLALKAAPAFMPALAGSSDGGDGGSTAAAAAAGAGISPASSSSGADGGVGTSPVLVLDEIDSGIGSRLGQPVGRILRRMAALGQGAGGGGQILCVTHLPQVSGCWGSGVLQGAGLWSSCLACGWVDTLPLPSGEIAQPSRPSPPPPSAGGSSSRASPGGAQGAARERAADHAV